MLTTTPSLPPGALEPAKRSDRPGASTPTTLSTPSPRACQPVETLANLRAIPNLLVIRPGDGNETVGAYQVAVANRKRPTVLALVLSAQRSSASVCGCGIGWTRPRC